MIYTLYLTQEGRTGQIPITDEEGKPFGSIRGRLDNPNHTLYLLDTSGNEIGLTVEELAALDPAERETRLARARAKLLAAGAHVVVDSVADLPGALEKLEIG